MVRRGVAAFRLGAAPADRWPTCCRCRRGVSSPAVLDGLSAPTSHAGDRHTQSTHRQAHPQRPGEDGRIRAPARAALDAACRNRGHRRTDGVAAGEDLTRDSVVRPPVLVQPVRITGMRLSKRWPTGRHRDPMDTAAPRPCSATPYGDRSLGREAGWHPGPSHCQGLVPQSWLPGCVCPDGLLAGREAHAVPVEEDVPCQDAAQSELKAAHACRGGEGSATTLHVQPSKPPLGTWPGAPRTRLQPALTVRACCTSWLAPPLSAPGAGPASSTRARASTAAICVAEFVPAASCHASHAGASGPRPAWGDSSGPSSAP